MKTFTMNKLKGFTLVELMVVMAIIAFLSVGAYAGLTFALRQGRDTQRVRRVDQIQTAIVAYYADYANYPGCPGNPNGAAVGSAVTGIPASYRYCPGAFNNTPSSLITAAPATGLKDYFEGDFSWAQLGDGLNTDTDIRYYYNKRASGGASEFTVCTVLENQRGGGNVTFHGEPAGGNKGCYCVGSYQSNIACAGMAQWNQR